MTAEPAEAEDYDVEQWVDKYRTTVAAWFNRRPRTPETKTELMEAIVRQADALGITGVRDEWMAQYEAELAAARARESDPLDLTGRPTDVMREMRAREPKPVGFHKKSKR